MLTYQLDTRAGVVELFGEPTGQPEEVRKLFARVVADPAYRRGFGFLRNRASLKPLSTPAVHALADALASVEGFAGTSWAFVAPEASNFGMLRMLEVLAEKHGVQVAVFSNELEARRWLAERGVSRGQREAP